MNKYRVALFYGSRCSSSSRAAAAAVAVVYSSIRTVVITSDEGGGKCVCPRSFVCLSVCLSVSKITQKHVHAFGWNFACRQMSGHGRTDQLLSPIRIIVRMPKPDCFLQYRNRCNAKFYYVGKIPRTGIGRPSMQRRVVLKWFYSPRAVGTTMSEVHALYRVPF